MSSIGASHKMTKPDLPLLVVVTGPPASGKTTFARALSEELRLPLVTKDDLKETLFDTLGTGDRAWSRRLGVASIDILFLVLRQQLATGLPMIVEANFWRSHDSKRFRSLPPHRAIQILVTAPRSVLLERYRERVRHPGHLGASVVPEVEIALDAGEWAALDLPGELIEVDTSRDLQISAIAERVKGGPAR